MKSSEDNVKFGLLDWVTLVILLAVGIGFGYGITALGVAIYHLIK